MFFFQAEDGIRDLVRSRGLGDVYKRQKKYLLIYFIFIVNIFCQEKKEFAQTKISYNPENYICYKTNAKIVIDGKFDENLSLIHI